MARGIAVPAAEDLSAGYRENNVIVRRKNRMTVPVDCTDRHCKCVLVIVEICLLRLKHYLFRSKEGENAASANLFSVRKSDADKLSRLKRYLPFVLNENVVLPPSDKLPVQINGDLIAVRNGNDPLFLTGYAVPVADYPTERLFVGKRAVEPVPALRESAEIHKPVLRNDRRPSGIAFPAGKVVKMRLSAVVERAPDKRPADPVVLFSNRHRLAYRGECLLVNAVVTGDEPALKIADILSPRRERRGILYPHYRALGVQTVKSRKSVKTIVEPGHIKHSPDALLTEYGPVVHCSGKQPRSVKASYHLRKPVVYPSPGSLRGGRLLVENRIEHDRRMHPVADYLFAQIPDRSLRGAEFAVFVYHDNAVFVAPVKKHARLGVMRAPEGVAPHLLYQPHPVADHRIRQRHSDPRVILMSAYPAQLQWPAVEEEPPVGIGMKITEPQRRDIKI